MRGPVQAALRRLTRLTRPLALRSAGSAGSATAVVVHVGRRSGASFKTPVVAVGHDGAFWIALPYGTRTDWAKNVVAAGHATILSGGRTYLVDRPEIVPMADATRYFGTKEQRLHRRFNVETAMRLRLRDDAPAAPTMQGK